MLDLRNINALVISSAGVDAVREGHTVERKQIAVLVFAAADDLEVTRSGRVGLTVAGTVLASWGKVLLSSPDIGIEAERRNRVLEVASTVIVGKGGTLCVSIAQIRAALEVRDPLDSLQVATPVVGTTGHVVGVSVGLLEVESCSLSLACARGAGGLTLGERGRIDQRTGGQCGGKNDRLDRHL